ncbi:MAG: hypothetical protein AAB583_00515, partial [Patescibacteria group bacterium]
MNIKLTIDYLIKAHKFIKKNKVLYLYLLFIYLISSILTAFTVNSLDPHGLMSLLGFVFAYLLVGYFVSLPILFNKTTSNEEIGIPQITKIILSNTKKIIKFSFLVVCILGFLMLLLYLFFDVLLQTKVVEQVFADTTKDHGFGFYPLKASFWALGELIFAPLFFLPIAYVLEGSSLWASLKRSASLAIKHRSFLFPILVLYAIYYFVCYLFIPDGNYFILPFRGIAESYFGALTMTAVFFFYKDHYKITPYVKNSITDAKKQASKPNRFVRWSIFGLLIMFVELNFFLGCILLAAYFKFDQQTIQRWTYIYIGVVVAIPFLFYILKLYKRFLGRNIMIAIIVFFGIVASFSFIPNQEQSIVEETKREFSSDKLWKAVNDKRVQYGVQRLEKNKWACKVAEIRLADNLKVGNGYFASEDGYSIAIQKVIGEYEEVDVIEKKDPMPEFASQYMFNAQNLNAGIQSIIDDKSYKELF